MIDGSFLADPKKPETVDLAAKSPEKVDHGKVLWRQNLLGSAKRLHEKRSFDVRQKTNIPVLDYGDPIVDSISRRIDSLTHYGYYTLHMGDSSRSWDPTEQYLDHVNIVPGPSGLTEEQIVAQTTAMVVEQMTRQSPGNFVDPVNLTTAPAWQPAPAPGQMNGGQTAQVQAPLVAAANSKCWAGSTNYRYYGAYTCYAKHCRS